MNAILFSFLCIGSSWITCFVLGDLHHHLRFTDLSSCLHLRGMVWTLTFYEYYFFRDIKSKTMMSFLLSNSIVCSCDLCKWHAPHEFMNLPHSGRRVRCEFVMIEYWEVFRWGISEIIFVSFFLRLLQCYCIIFNNGCFFEICIRKVTHLSFYHVTCSARFNYSLRINSRPFLLFSLLLWPHF